MAESFNNVTANPSREKPQFPEGLRVLAVDDNEVCLKVIEAQLIKCRFIVTATTKATEALQILRKNRESYDIVITDVEMPDMNGFKLLEIIGLEMDMPVIMMSASDDMQTVMKGIRHGARDYLTKPVRLAEVKNIWQHVLRKNLSDPKKLGAVTEVKDQNLEPSKARRQRGNEKEDETNAQSDEEAARTRKPRLAWTKDLHNKFLDAVQQIGVNAFPKKILEKMNDPRLSRENVASHLQKYRNSIKKAKMNQESENCSTTISHLPNPNPISTGIPSFDTQYRTFGAFPANNGRPQLYNQNKQQTLLPQNLVTRQMAGQPYSTVPIPAPIFVQNSSNPELDWMRFYSDFSRAKMVNGHRVDSSPHYPIFNNGQFGPTTIPNVPYSCPPSGAFNLAGAPFQGSTHLNHISQLDSLQQSSSHGQYEGRINLVNFNGRGESPITQFVQHPFEISEKESNGLSSNYDCPDDDLSLMFSSNAPPRL